MPTNILNQSADWIASRSQVVAGEIDFIASHDCARKLRDTWVESDLGLKAGIAWNLTLNAIMHAQGIPPNEWLSLRSQLGLQGTSSTQDHSWMQSFISRHAEELCHSLTVSKKVVDIRSPKRLAEAAKHAVHLLDKRYDMANVSTIMSVGGAWQGEVVAVRSALNLAEDCRSLVIDPAAVDFISRPEDILYNLYPEDQEYLDMYLSQEFSNRCGNVDLRTLPLHDASSFFPDEGPVLVISSSFFCSVANPQKELDNLHKLPTGSLWLSVEANPVMENLHADIVVESFQAGRSLGITLAKPA